MRGGSLSPLSVQTSQAHTRSGPPAVLYLMPPVTSQAEILGLGTNGALVIDSGGDVRANSSSSER